MVAFLGLELLNEVGPLNAVLLSDALKSLLDSLLHALQTAHVDESVVLLHHVPELFRVFLHAVLDIHLVSILVILLAGNGIVVLELVAAELLHLLELLIVQESGGSRDAEEKPGLAIELVVGVLFEEEAPQERSERRNTGARSKHDNVRLRIIWK